jgi:hypothetical protein
VFHVRPSEEAEGEFTKVKQLFWPVFRCLCRQAAYEVNYLPLDFLAIATQGLVNAKYRGSQILPRVYTPHKGQLEQDFTAKLVKQLPRSNVPKFWRIPPQATTVAAIQ